MKMIQTTCELSGVNALKGYFGSFHHQLMVHAHQSLVMDIKSTDPIHSQWSHAAHDGQTGPCISLHNHE